MNEVQRIQFEMLTELDTICRRHGLTYYLACGTCLGAVREGGFIPWDHDIDVFMSIDTSKQIEQYQNEFSENVFISSRRTDSNNKTIKTVLENRDKKCRLKIGETVVKDNVRIGLDIYPLYSCPNNKSLLIMMIWISHFQKLLVGGIPQNHGVVAKLLSSILLALVPIRIRSALTNSIERILSYKDNSDLVCTYYGLDIGLFDAITYRKEWFGQPKELSFEGKLFFVPNDYDSYLSKRYGNYMVPASQKERANETYLEIIE